MVTTDNEAPAPARWPGVVTEVSERAVPVRLGRSRRLSPMQRSLLASQLSHPDQPSQNMALLSHLDGQIDPDRLAAAFASVVANHDVLRTRIGEAGSPSVDAVALAPADALPPTEILDMERGAVEAWARRKATVPLDLSIACWQSAVVAHPDGTASWYLNLHHVITDATSSAMVFQATAAAYHGLDPVPSTSYYDWSDRLAEAMQRPDGPTTKAAEHWRNRPTAPGLGRLYRAPDRPAPPATRRRLDLGDLGQRAAERLGTDLRMLTEHLGWSTLLVTATALWCHRVTGADRFAVGLPVHNRNDVESRNLIGPTMEVFPVDIEIEATDTARIVHERVGRSIMRTLARAVPGTAPASDHEVVVNVIPRAEQSSFGPIPAVTSWLHPGAIDGSHLARLQMTAYADRRRAADRDGSAGFEFALDLNDGAADPDHRDRAPEHLLAVLGAIIDDTDTPLADWGLCSPGERAVLERWGHGGDLRTDAPRVVDALRRALTGGSSIVLSDAERELTGNELLAWIDAAAAWLRDQGVGPGVRVAVDLPRSIEAVVTFLATLMAGGSFVPLDPSQPESRRRRLAERASCHLVVGSTATIAATRPEPGTAPAVSPSPSWSDNDEAYVIFTSGSTGEPKGVPITRLGLAHYLQFAVERYSGDGRPPVVAPLFSPLTFDLTITSLFLPFLTGGRLIVVAEDGPRALSTVARRTEITWLKATPSHLEILVRLLPDDHALATLVVGGEAFGSRLAADLLAGHPERDIHNEYGPTEAVVGCMDYLVEPDLLDGQADVPIGGPAPGVDLAIVDRYGHRVPVGSPGELWISHAGLTSGYLTDSGAVEADQAFVDWEGRRWYRSGDLVRLQDRERLVYLGRIDEQIKVGGVRLEPMEVEEALAAHPALAAGAVRLWSPSADGPAAHCIRCGLPDNIPGVGFDDRGVCDTCHAYDRVAPVAESWFRTPDDLVAVQDRARRRRTGDYDCLHLLSGGKDSTYALYQLVEAGFRPYALTLDNGFISEGAKDNVRRSVADLGVDHEFVTLDEMNAIFRDSLDRHSNVCHGCYKAIYTVATNRADELGIPLIVTGLSRGQLFETRLIPQQFSADRFDPDAIDRAVLAARKVYHRLDDGPNRLLDTEVFAEDDVFDRIEYLDFYRYIDVELAEMLRFLENRAPWVRPADTGRSTNCLVNAAGIHTHQSEQGYHNYAVPYAWDVRLGHKTRQEAIEELDDRLDLAEVEAMLDEIGYRPRRREVLTAWVVPSTPEGAVPPPAELRAFLATSLPAAAIPSAFVTVDHLPLSTNGKLDAAALPRPERVHRSGPTLTLSPTTATEKAVIEVWERVLATEPIGIDDDFFALGGDSLAALEMIVAVGERLGRSLGEDLAFTNPTPRGLAETIDLGGAAELDPDAPLDEPAPSDRSTPVDLADHRTEPGTRPTRSDGELSILHEQAERAGQVMYNTARLYLVSGAVDPERFVGTVRDVAACHQTLSWSYANPRHLLTPDEAVGVTVGHRTIGVHDLDDVVAAIQRPAFDLERGPLLRVAIHPVDDGRTAVALAFHHASGDGGSFDVLWRQIDRRLTDGQLPDLAVDYAGLTRWQRDRDPAGHQAFWLDQAGSDAPASLAVHRSGAEEPDGYISRTSAVTPDRLRSTAGATPAAVGLAAAAAVVDAYSDGRLIEVGLVTSTRDHPAADDLVGYLVNTVPVRLDLSVDPSLGRLVSTANASIGAALAHRSYPRARMQADRRQAGLADLASEVMVAYEEIVDLQLDGSSVSQEVAWNGTSVAPMTFFVVVGPDRLDLGLEYQGAVVDAATAADILAVFDGVFTAILDDPDRATGQAVGQSLASAGALALIEGDTPDTATQLPTLLEPIVHHLETRGDHPAVVCGDRTMSWEALAIQARAVAALVSAEFGPGAAERRVVVCLPRSPELVAAIVGVHLAGCSYVPIDPGYPEERVALLAEGSGAAVALVSPGGPEPLTRSIPITAEGLAAGPVQHRPLPAVGADDEAYVIFTSGSTGQPRGVPVSHARLAASTDARASVYPERPERFLMPSSAAFDSSVVGLFWTLRTGGTIVLPAEDEVNDVAALVDLMAAGISHTLLVPTLYQALLDHSATADRWPGRVIVAGEACPPALLDAHDRRWPGSALTNEYGPTEATVWASAHHCRPGEHPVPIGSPVPGGWLAVVDGAPGWERVRPRRTVGQLVVGGPAVVDGYLDDDDASATAFGQLPAVPGTELAPGTSRRLFRTGDRAAAVGDEFVFLGRDDDRLNLGGVRAEPEEIERALVDADGVAAAVVVSVDVRSVEELLVSLQPDDVAEAMRRASEADDPGAALGRGLRRLAAEGTSTDLRLVAHLEGRPDLDLDAVRGEAKRRLPPTLRPGRYVVHDRLPRTPNGKLDRAAARDLAPGGTEPAPVRSTVRPLPNDPGNEDDHDTVAALARLFASALRMERFDPDDSFFDHGGHSLLAMELVLSIEDQLGSRLPASALYDEPTPRGLAELLAPAGLGSGAEGTSGRSAATAGLLIPIQTDGDRPPLFAIHVLGVDCQFFRPLSARLGPEQPMYGLGQPTADLETGVPTDVAGIAATYRSEIDRLVPSGPVGLCAISLGGVVAFELAQQLIEHGRTVDVLALFDATGPDLPAPTTSDRIGAQLTRIQTDPGRYVREQVAWQSEKLQRSGERLAVAASRRLGLRTSHRLEIRRFIEDNVRAQVNYRYDPLAVPMLVVKAGDDPMADDLIGQDMGWRRLAIGGLTIDRSSGAHLSMMAEPNVQRVAELVAESMTGAVRRRSDRTGRGSHVDIEAALIRAVHGGNLSPAMARLRPVAEPGSAGAELLDRLDRVQTDLATVAEEAAARTVAAFTEAGLEAKALPVPTRLSFPVATVETSTGPSQVAAITELMADHGFRAIAATNPAADARLRGRLDFLAAEGTARVQLRWPWVDGAGRLYRAVRRRLDRHGGTDLGILLGTPTGLVAPLLASADIGPGSCIVDLGCGDGRVLIEAARIHGCRGRGYELDPGLAELARRRVEAAGMTELVDIITGDARTAEVADADLVFAFLPAEAVNEVFEPVLTRMRPGAVYLSHEQHPIPVPRPPHRQHLVIADGAERAQRGITVANLWLAGVAASDHEHS